MRTGGSLCQRLTSVCDQAKPIRQSCRIDCESFDRRCLCRRRVQRLGLLTNTMAVSRRSRRDQNNDSTEIPSLASGAPDAALEWPMLTQSGPLETLISHRAA